MKWKSNYIHPKNWCFVIEHDEEAGYYLYVYDETGFNIQDELQESLDVAKDQASDDFGVPLDSWEEVVD